jgi:hypothetical protein
VKTCKYFQVIYIYINGLSPSVVLFVSGLVDTAKIPGEGTTIPSASRDSVRSSPGTSLTTSASNITSRDRVADKSCRRAYASHLDTGFYAAENRADSLSIPWPGCVAKAEVCICACTNCSHANDSTLCRYLPLRPMKPCKARNFKSQTKWNYHRIQGSRLRPVTASTWQNRKVSMWMTWLREYHGNVLKICS